MLRQHSLKILLNFRLSHHNFWNAVTIFSSLILFFAYFLRPAMPMAFTVFHCMTHLVSFSWFHWILKTNHMVAETVSTRTWMHALTCQNFEFRSCLTVACWHLPSIDDFRCWGNRIYIVPCRGRNCFCGGEEDWRGTLLHWNTN